MVRLKSKSNKLSFCFLFSILISIIVFPAFAQLDRISTILFYNPEININNFASVKAMFDKYLSAYGNYKFQPFNKRKIFEDSIEKIDSPKLLILSSWHYRSLNKKIPLTPTLIAVRDGKFTFKKTLLGRKPISTIDDLAEKTVASSGSRENTLDQLREMLGKDNTELLANIRILNVPKDIDALMAVAFGVAQAAITTEASLKQIEQINPKLKEKLTVLLTSGEILMPVVSVMTQEGDKENLDELINVLMKMNSTKSGREKLAVLSMDGWDSIPPNILERLNK